MIVLLEYIDLLVLTIYHIKLKTHLSAFFPHQAANFAVSAWINARLAQNKSYVPRLQSASLFLKVSNSYSFSTRVRDSHLCRTIQPLTTADLIIQCKIEDW